MSERRMLIAKGDYENTRMCEDADGTEGTAPETHKQQAHEVRKGQNNKYNKYNNITNVAAYTYRHRRTFFCALFHMQSRRNLGTYTEYIYHHLFNGFI